ncbi:MAG TPA: toll/interleukin-1 receptor domain-containing protein [Allosphingosinicella sp.]|nr:toll/interleukin-1 receptor domain-containing protein [Allosphingosinicella sp.]
MSAGHVFISHGSENAQEANEIAAFLEARGLQSWIAPRDVRPGMDYSEQLQAAIEGCLAFVVLISETANTSPYVRAETEMAFSNNKPIFPVRQSDIKPAAGLAFFLNVRHWTNAFGAGAEANMERLALELTTLAGLAPASPPLAPPSRIADPAPVALVSEPEVRAGLPKSTMFAMLAAGLLVVAIAVFLVVQQNQAPVPAPVPQPVPSPGPGPEPAPSPEPAPPAPATASIDRGSLVGRWGINGDCANGLEFTDDGRVLTMDGTAGGVWALNGDVLSVTTNTGEQHSARINSVDQSALYSTDPNGTVEVSTRC